MTKYFEKTKPKELDYWWPIIKKENEEKIKAETVKYAHKPKTNFLTKNVAAYDSDAFVKEGWTHLQRVQKKLNFITQNKKSNKVHLSVNKKTENLPTGNDGHKKVLPVNPAKNCENKIPRKTSGNGIAETVKIEICDSVTDSFLNFDDDKDWDDFVSKPPKAKSFISPTEKQCPSKKTSAINYKSVIEITDDDDSNSSFKENGISLCKATEPSKPWPSEPQSRVMFDNPDCEIPSDYDDVEFNDDIFNSSPSESITVIPKKNLHQPPSVLAKKLNCSTPQLNNRESNPNNCNIETVTPQLKNYIYTPQMQQSCVVSDMDTKELQNELELSNDMIFNLALSFYQLFMGRSELSKDMLENAHNGSKLIKRRSEILCQLQLKSRAARLSCDWKSLSPSVNNTPNSNVTPSPISNAHSIISITSTKSPIKPIVPRNYTCMDEMTNFDLDFDENACFDSNHNTGLPSRTTINGTSSTSRSLSNTSKTLPVAPLQTSSRIVNEGNSGQNVQGVSGLFTGKNNDDGSTPKFKGFDFPHSKKMMEAFREVFGLKSFRYHQLETINAALMKEDCFVLMPTGGGKSLCYQLPAIVADGVTIVVSPLRSLIQDQVQKLNSLGVKANHLSGEHDVNNSNLVYHKLNMRDPDIQLLYVTPEKISASQKLLSTFESLYKRNMLQRFVIDEAHCVSQWGHDFRPDYKKLCSLREKFPGVPLMALTATATPRVRTDILLQLKMSNPKWFLQSFNRPNLIYKIVPKKPKSVSQDVIDVISKDFWKKSGIVYCLSRKDCDNQAEALIKAGINAISYHAGLDGKKRYDVQEKWINDNIQVICATIAFGMGIDKPDVRFVIHQSLPQSVESYYQESGRAGRDGELSTCILFYNYSDKLRIVKLIEMDKTNFQAQNVHKANLTRVVQFCENKVDCRRIQMLQYFGEVFDKRFCVNHPKAACDNCLSKGSYQKCDITEQCREILQCVSDLVGMNGKTNLTLNHFIDIFKGSNSQKMTMTGHNQLKLHGLGKNFTRTDCERTLQHLVLEGYLREEIITNAMDFASSYIRLGGKAQNLLKGQAKVAIDIGQNTKYNSLNVVESFTENPALKDLSEQCYVELIDMSKALGIDLGIHYTNVINVKALREMSREMPMSENEMLAIPHVTRVLFDKFGQRFLKITMNYGLQKQVIEIKEALAAGEAENEDFSDFCGSSESATTSRGRGRKRAGGAQRFGGAKKKFKPNFRGRGKGRASYSKTRGHRGVSNSGVTTVSSSRPTTSVTKRGPGFLLESRAPSRSFLMKPKTASF